MIRGITVYRNRIAEAFFHTARFIPIAGMQLYLVLVSVLMLPVGLACCILVLPVARTTQFVKQKRYIPLLIRTAGSLEQLGLLLSHSCKSVAGFFHSIRKSMRWQWPLS